MRMNKNLNKLYCTNYEAQGHGVALAVQAKYCEADCTLNHETHVTLGDIRGYKGLKHR
jgi:hypothetical protein